MPRTRGWLTPPLCWRNNGRVSRVREVSVAELFESSRDPFVRHQVDPASTQRAWTSGAATVVLGTRGRPNETAAGPVLTCLGPADELGPLMDGLVTVAPRPWRLSVESTSYDDVPAAWRHREHHAWHWMLTLERCPAPDVPVVELDTDGVGAGEIDVLLDAANPDSFARPGVAGIECWLGIRERGLLVAAGALVRQPDGTGHLRGVSVLPVHTGRGLGRALSAGLTRRALATGPGVSTLGVYTDNAAAMSVYRRLDYELAHTFVSGPVRSE